MLSCNKYRLCPTYDELEKRVESLQKKYNELIGAAQGLTLYREGTSCYTNAEEVVQKHCDTYKQASLVLLKGINN